MTDEELRGLRTTLLIPRISFLSTPARGSIRLLGVLCHYPIRGYLANFYGLRDHGIAGRSIANLMIKVKIVGKHSWSCEWYFGFVPVIPMLSTDEMAFRPTGLSGSSTVTCEIANMEVLTVLNNGGKHRIL